jgi:hypothetical protein
MLYPLSYLSQNLFESPFGQEESYRACESALQIFRDRQKD